MKMRAISKSERKLAIRQQAKRVVAGKHDLTAQGDYRQKVAKGLKEVEVVSSEAGDSKAIRIRNELTYLINNYLPANDARIGHLIEEWRRSGDPTYDPAIRVKLRQARQQHMTKSNPY